MRFAEKLEYLIGLRETNQSQLSRRTGIAQSAISDMTKGRRRAYMDQALLLAKALEVPLGYLADDDQAEIPPEVMTARERQVWEVVRLLGVEEAMRRLVQVPGGPASGAVLVPKLIQPPGVEDAKRKGAG